jgi:hypothetical protein
MLQVLDQMMLDMFLRPFLNLSLSSFLSSPSLSLLFSHPLSNTTTTSTTKTELLFSSPILSYYFYVFSLLSFVLPMMRLSKSILYMEYELMIKNL